MNEEYWSAVRTLRLGVADFLDSLHAEEWDALSLCQGWRVRDVAGHLALVPTITTWDMVSVAPGAGFDPDRINTALAVRHGSEPTDRIVAKLRQHAADRRTARMLSTRNALFDAIVHSQDIALALGRDFAVEVEPTRRGLDRVWAMGWPFHARRRSRGISLRATDTDWSVGAGPEVAGKALTLLLLLTGRTATAIDSLEGPGVGAVRAKEVGRPT